MRRLHLRLFRCLLTVLLFFTAWISMLWVVRSLYWRNQRQDVTPRVVIVEEHHEVLPYWFETFRSGLIPPKGLTLVHIDGHSDLALPLLRSGMPLFTPPTNKEQLTSMIQGNDCFIKQAVMSGWIKRVIWIWPQWDVPNHSGNFNNVTTYIGIHDNLPFKSGPSRLFCECSTANGVPEPCYAMTPDNGELIPPGKCKRITSFQWQEIQETTALEMLSAGTLLDTTEEVLLDIDEDFFGCEAAIQPLLDVGISEKETDELTDWVGMVFCPVTAQAETDAHQLMLHILRLFAKGCNVSRSPCSDPEAIIEAMKTLVMSALQSHPQIICTPHGHFYEHSKFVQLYEYLSRRTNEQLDALAEVGFCKTGTPKSNDTEEDGLFRVCSGYNTPANTSVLFHTPSTTELASRMQILKQILLTPRLRKPKLVTICRSMRDGYTPRKYFTYIEHGILSNFGDFTKHYDEDLLAGVAGWPGRHQFTPS